MPSRYEPAPDTVPPDLLFTVTVTFGYGLNMATYVASFVTVTLIVAAFGTTGVAPVSSSRVQPSNVQYFAGVAFSVTTLSSAYLPLPVAVPPFLGSARARR